MQLDMCSLVADCVDLVDDGIMVTANDVVQCGYANISWTGASVSDVCSVDCMVCANDTCLSA